MTRAQSSIEFLILMALGLVIFVTLFAFVSDQYLEAQEQRDEQLFLELAGIVGTELDLAAQANDGYTRTFTLPQTIGGLNYTMALRNDSVLTFCLLDTSIYCPDGGEFVRAYSHNISGSIYKGVNTITKRGNTLSVSSSDPCLDDDMQENNSFCMGGACYCNEGHYDIACSAPGDTVDETCSLGCQELDLCAQTGIYYRGPVRFAVTIGETLTEQLDAVSSAGANLTFLTEDVPEGMTLGHSSGVLSFTPLQTQNGTHNVTVTIASDHPSENLTDITLYIEVVADGDTFAPLFSIEESIFLSAGTPFIPFLTRDETGSLIHIHLDGTINDITTSTDLGSLEKDINRTALSGIHPAVHLDGSWQEDDVDTLREAFDNNTNLAFYSIGERMEHCDVTSSQSLFGEMTRLTLVNPVLPVLDGEYVGDCASDISFDHFADYEAFTNITLLSTQEVQRNFSVFGRKHYFGGLEDIQFLVQRVNETVDDPVMFEIQTEDADGTAARPQPEQIALQGWMALAAGAKGLVLEQQVEDNRLYDVVALGMRLDLFDHVLVSSPERVETSHDVSVALSDPDLGTFTREQGIEAVRFQNGTESLIALIRHNDTFDRYVHGEAHNVEVTLPQEDASQYFVYHIRDQEARALDRTIIGTAGEERIRVTVPRMEETALLYVTNDTADSIENELNANVERLARLSYRKARDHRYTFPSALVHNVQDRRTHIASLISLAREDLDRGFYDRSLQRSALANAEIRRMTGEGMLAEDAWVRRADAEFDLSPFPQLNETRRSPYLMDDFIAFVTSDDIDIDSHQPPRITSAVPAHGSVSSLDNITLAFSDPMARQSVNESLRFIRTFPSEGVVVTDANGTFDWSEDNTSVIFTPSREWGSGQQVEAVLRTDAVNNESDALAAPFRLIFTHE